MSDQFKIVEEKYGSHLLNYAQYSNYAGSDSILVTIVETLLEYSVLLEQEEVDLNIATAIFIVERSEQLPQHLDNKVVLNATLEHIIAWCQIRFKKWRILPKRDTTTYKKEILRIYERIKNEYNWTS